MRIVLHLLNCWRFQAMIDESRETALESSIPIAIPTSERLDVHSIGPPGGISVTLKLASDGRDISVPVSVTVPSLCVAFPRPNVPGAQNDRSNPPHHSLCREERAGP